MSATSFTDTGSSLAFPKTFPVMIRSNQFPQCLLRMAGEASPQRSEHGFGLVNCQADQNDPDKNPWEIFNVIRNDDGTVSFESQAFPSNYLRMEGVQSPSPSAPGFGTVNCQAYIGSLERFKVAVLSDTANGVLTSIESNAYPSNYLRMAGEVAPVPTAPGFGTVNCQAYVGPYEQFHLGAVLKDSVNTLRQWFPDQNPTQAQIEELVAAIITGKEPPQEFFEKHAELSSFMTLADHEMDAINSIDLASVSSCVIAVATFCIDILLFALQLASIYIMKTDAMIRAAVAALGEGAGGLVQLIEGIANAATRGRQAILIFQFISQLFNIGFIKGVIKTVVSGFSWFGAIVAAVSFVATVVAWIATDGALLIAQIILAIAALASIIADAIAVGRSCGTSNSSALETAPA